MNRFLKGARWIFWGRSQRAVYLQIIVWGVLALGVLILWRELKPAIDDGSAYSIRLENILICDPPPWISDRFVSEALTYLPFDRKLDALTSLDSDLVDVLTLAFDSHPWVAQVEKVEILYPAQIKIRLKFRQPVAIVDPALATIKAFHQEIDMNSGYDQNLLKAFSISDSLDQAFSSERYVVDETGYRLPDEFLQNNKNAYAELPLLCGSYWGGATTPGAPLDDFMADSALFASFLKECGALEKFEIEQIYILRKTGQRRGVYFLRTKKNGVCLWGRFALDRKTRNDETYSGERSAPKWEDARQKLFEEQREKLARWGDAYTEAAKEQLDRPDDQERNKTADEGATKESTDLQSKCVYFSVASQDELLN